MAPTFSYGISAGAAVCAGLSIAGAGVLQQRAASRRPSGERLSATLLRRLVSDRTWLAGIGLAALSYGFQAVALTFGPLALVQPLIVSELLFAIPVSVRLRKLRPRKRDWATIGMIVAGLAIGIVAADPRRGDPVQAFWTWLPALVAVAVVSGAAVLLTRVLSGPPRATAFALAGAVLMALQSALYDATIQLLRQDHWLLFAHWEPYALVVASVAGMFLIQNAFQAGPLAASTPVIDATLPLLAVALGVWLFGEHVRTTPVGLGGAALGVVLLVVGIVLLDRSPVVRKEQRIEEEEQEQTARQEAGQHA
jgi:drug/metabolite transporter (DMT)-like permease